MASTLIQFEERKAIRASMTVVVNAGEKEIVLSLPEAVPQNQSLVLNIEATGSLVAADKAPEGRIDVGTVVTQ